MTLLCKNAQTYNVEGAGWRDGGFFWGVLWCVRGGDNAVVVIMFWGGLW